MLDEPTKKIRWTPQLMGKKGGAKLKEIKGEDYFKNISKMGNQARWSKRCVSILFARKCLRNRKEYLSGEKCPCFKSIANS